MFPKTNLYQSVQPDSTNITYTTSSDVETTVLNPLTELFCDELSQVHLFQFTSGRSNASVWRATPYYGFCEGAAVILKVGPREKIAQERENYDRFVAPYLHEACSRLHTTDSEGKGVLVYNFIGGELSKTVSFADYYETQGTASICNAIDKLFGETCRRWYDNRAPGKQIKDMVECYENTLHMDWDKIWATVTNLGVDVEAERFSLPGVSGQFINPKNWLEKRAYTLCRPVFLSMTHGDFNDQNILVTETGNCWLIDFSRTGWSHILRDVAGLEATIKLRLTKTANLNDYLALEHLLSQQDQLRQSLTMADTHPYAKSVAAIGRLRYFADILTGVSEAMPEYYGALLLTMLNALRYPSLTTQQAQQALLSASLLCEYLEN